jgi:hypothetical protein
MEQSYDFKALEKFIDSKFLYASDCIEMLEKIEHTLACMEQVFVLHPDITNAIGFFEELKLCLEESIPNEKKRH